MNRSYYFTDETAKFRQPVQPEKGQEVCLRFQTAKDDQVVIRLIHGEERHPLKAAESCGNLQFYEITVLPETDTYDYYFEIQEYHEFDSARSVCFYDKRGVVTDVDPNYRFTIRPGYVIPDWLQGAVLYQIFTDRFRDGDNRNDVQDREYIYVNKKPVERVHDWSSPVSTLDVGRFYGGDLPGIREKLNYLQALGVEVLYLNPIFVSPSNHKYDSQDYDNVDPHLTVIREDGGNLLEAGAEDNSGATRYRKRTTDPVNLEASNQYFADFVEEIHRRGMKIILDGVFNHCGSFNRWMDREGFYRDENMPEEKLGAWKNPKSETREYFNFREDGSYEAWWDVQTLPKLNFEHSGKLQQEILRIAAKWVSPPYNIDGWRLDVAADLGHTPEFNHRFWKMFRRTVKEANPNAVILAEHYGDVSPWLQGGEWDTVMNYDAFMEPVTWFLTGMEKHSDHYSSALDGNAEAFWALMQKNMARFSFGSLYGAMNQLDNHDHSRFITRTNRKTGRLATLGAEAAEQGIKPGILRQAVVMQMTWPGAPTLYYGDETAVCGWTDPDCRRTYPWGKEDWHMIDFYTYAIGIHRKYAALRTGSLVKLHGADQVVAYGRFDDKDQFAVVINAGRWHRTLNLDLGIMGVRKDSSWIRIMQTTESHYNVGMIRTVLGGTVLNCEVPPMSAAIYRAVSDHELEQIIRSEQ